VIGFGSWRRQGEHWIWLNAMAIALCVIMVFGLVFMIAFRGLAYFWPADLAQYVYLEHDRQELVVGEVSEEVVVSDPSGTQEGFQDKEERKRIKLKVGNRDLYGSDFRWIWFDQIKETAYPADLIAVEREEWGNFYGFFEGLTNSEGEIIAGGNYEDLLDLLPAIKDYRSGIARITHDEINRINAKHERLRLERREAELKRKANASQLEDFAERKARLDREYMEAEARLLSLESDFESLGGVILRAANGEKREIRLNQVYKVWKPNAMSLIAKIGAYISNIWGFLSENPREANTEGGVFPAIFGTVVMVFLMTVVTTPMGVVAAIYIREYARQGVVIRLVRICVNNLAGVPSIVYGVFGLGFFVYFIGGSIDQLFYPEALPAPTFGSAGVLWASLTLAILTLPVVIVSAEEGFARIPGSVREGSMALGATKFETIFKVLLPMSTPAIMTGMILAIARAAGEVAPLMLVGVVKLAPDLVVDGTAPFIHLDRKFMHLGFHIYDVGFQSPNVDASTPLVYATAFLLLLVIIVLNITAIMVRNRLRERYKQLDM